MGRNLIDTSQPLTLAQLVHIAVLISTCAVGITLFANVNNTADQAKEDAARAIKKTEDLAGRTGELEKDVAVIKTEYRKDAVNVGKQLENMAGTMDRIHGTLNVFAVSIRENAAAARNHDHDQGSRP